MIVIVVKPGSPDPVTLRVAVPETGPNCEPMEAVMVVTPDPTDVAKPDESIVAVAVVEEDHVTKLVISCVSDGCRP
jgi:hypothetical protein